MSRPQRPSDDLATAHIRVKFDVWPARAPMPTTPQAAAMGAIHLTLPDVVRGDVAVVHIVRYAPDGVSLWLLNTLEHASLQDLIRAVAGAYEPPAYAIAAVQGEAAKGDPLVRRVGCRAALGAEQVRVSGDLLGLDGPPEQRRIERWMLQRAHPTHPNDGWIGVPPSVPIAMPIRNAAEA